MARAEADKARRRKADPKTGSPPGVLDIVLMRNRAVEVVSVYCCAERAAPSGIPVSVSGVLRVST